MSEKKLKKKFLLNILKDNINYSLKFDLADDGQICPKRTKRFCLFTFEIYVSLLIQMDNISRKDL